jgi:tetratricopeptide (TPR) repeat protein
MQAISIRVASVAALLLALLITVNSSTWAQSNPILEAKTMADTGNYLGADQLLTQALASSPDDVGLLVAAGDIKMKLEAYPQAVGLFSRAYESRKKDGVIARKYGEALSQAGNCSEAIKILLSARKLNDTPESWAALGDAYLMCGSDSSTRAELTFQEADNKFPKNAGITVALGDLYYSRKIYELAQAKYEEALVIDPALIEPRIRLGRSYRAQGAQEETLEAAQPWYQKAVFEFNNVTARAPREPQPWREQGEILIFAGEYEKAMQSLTTYQSLRPDDPRGDTLLARAAYLGTYYLQAIPALERILARTDSVSLAYHPQARLMLGKSYYADKKYDLARKEYEMVPDSSLGIEGTKLYASALMLSGDDTSRALTLYKKMSDANPGDCELSGQLGSMLYSTGRYNDAIDVWSKRMTSCPGNDVGTAYFYIGLSQFALKRYDKAVDALKSCIAADTSVEQAYYWLLNAYGAKKDFARGADVARLMEERDFQVSHPRWIATAWYFAGIAQFQAKKFKEAVPLFERGVKADPSFTENYLYIAFSYQSINDKDNACKYYNQVIRMGGENVKIARDNMKSLGCK